MISVKKSNSHAQSKIGVSHKDLTPTRMSCHVDIGTLGEIEGSEYYTYTFSPVLMLLLYRYLKFLENSTSAMVIHRQAVTNIRCGIV